MFEEKLVKPGRSGLNNMKRVAKNKRHISIRKHLAGSANQPRLAVFRSSQHIYAQLIDDQDGKTLCFQSDLKLTGNKTEKAFNVGKSLAQQAVKQDIITVVFDRGGFLYHGRIKAVAEGAREGGLKF